MESLVRGVEHDYVKVNSIIFALNGLYPFLTVQSIGKSVLGREILALEIPGGGSAGKHSAVLLAGGFHGMERLTTLVLLRFAESLCNALSANRTLAGMEVRRTIYGRRVLIVPLVNPDGCEIALKGEIGAGLQSGFARRVSGGDFASWNANARGVDINHNFDAGWDTLQKMEHEAGIWGPAPRRYGGPCPESEPETKALTALCRNRDISTVLAFHSQGEEIYWSYGKNTPLRSKKLARIFAASSGYAVEEPMGLASNGGFKDWFIQEFGRPGFTIEIGRGKNPLDPALLEEIYAQIEEMMMLACVV